MQMQSSSYYALLSLVEKLTYTIESCVDAQKSSMDSTAELINGQWKKMQKDNRWLACLQLGTGVLGGMGNVAAQSLQGINNPFAKVAGLIIPILPKIGEFGITLISGDLTRLQSHNAMKRDHELALQKELKSSLSASDNEISQKMQRIQEAKAQGDRLH